MSIKKLLLLFLTFFALTQSFSQEIALEFPSIWLRADSTEAGSETWRDISGNSVHGMWEPENIPSGFILMNYNPAFEFIRGMGLNIPGIDMPNRNVTVMLVHQVSDSVTEQPLWTICSTECMGMTSKKIFSSDREIVYSELNSTDVIVSSITQPFEEIPSGAGEIKLGLHEDLYLEGKLSEFIFFKDRILNEDLLRWASYLAIKYGVTLHSSNYYSSDLDTIWNYSDHPGFSCSISGLGRDTRLGLNQKQTLAVKGKVIFGSGSFEESNENNDYLIPDGNFLIIGSDSSLLGSKNEIHLENDYRMVSYGNCLMDASGSEASGISSFLHVDASGWEGHPDRYHLFIDRSGTGDFNSADIEFYSPYRVGEDSVLYFRDIHWDTDGNGTDLFCFAYLTVDSLANHELVYGMYPEDVINGLIESGLLTVSDAGDNIIPGNRNSVISGDEIFHGNIYEVFPNPSEGTFKLGLHYKEVTDVVVNISTMEGKVIRVHKGKGNSSYYFEDFIPVSGQYLVEIESGLETKSIKLIVN